MAWENRLTVNVEKSEFGVMNNAGEDIEAPINQIARRTLDAIMASTGRLVVEATDSEITITTEALVEDEG